MIQHGSDLRFAVQDELFSFSRDQLALESRHPGPGFRHRLTAMSNGRASKVQRSENKTFLELTLFALLGVFSVGHELNLIDHERFDFIVIELKPKIN